MGRRLTNEALQILLTQLNGAEGGVGDEDGTIQRFAFIFFH
jgi:hypothetical protein